MYEKKENGRAGLVDYEYGVLRTDLNKTITFHSSAARRFSTLFTLSSAVCFLSVLVPTRIDD